MMFAELAERCAEAMFIGATEVELAPGKIYQILEMPNGTKEVTVGSKTGDFRLVQLSGKEKTIPGQIVKNFDRHIVKIWQGRKLLESGTFDGMFVDDIEIVCHTFFIRGMIPSKNQPAGV